jgi:DNA repair protein RadC
MLWFTLTAIPRDAPHAANAHMFLNYITDRVKQALALVDIKVLDHIIVAGGETMSFAERGMIK